MMKKIVVWVLFPFATITAGDSGYDEQDYLDFQLLHHRVEFEGHIWIPVWLEHHPMCPCQDSSSGSDTDFSN